MQLTAADRRLAEDGTRAGDALVARAVKWCSINSGSDNRAGLDEMAVPLIQALSALPGTVELIPLADGETITAQGEHRRHERASALRLSVRPTAESQIVLTGHYDTVFPIDTAFRHVREEANGSLNGPGIADMKGGISVMLGALSAFETHPAMSRLGYTVLLSPDEETGSLGSAPLLAAAAITAHVGMTFEPALADGTLASARKGSGNYHLVVRGRAAHAGRDFERGRNAMALAARMAVALDGLNGLREGVTINVARIDGGGALNIVPDTAILRFNVRIPDDAARRWLDAAIAEILAGSRGDGLSVDLHGGINRPPKPFLPAQHRLFENLQALGALIGQPLAWRASGGVCEGNNLFAAGVPCIDTLGVRGGEIHSTREYARPESFAERAALSALMLAKLADGSIDARGLHSQFAGERSAANISSPAIEERSCATI